MMGLGVRKGGGGGMMSDVKNLSCGGVHAHVLSTDDCLTQLMTTDSDSTLQLYGAMENGERDDTTVFRGSVFAGFDKGSASFQLAIEPAFENVSTDLGAVLHRQPHVYASGNGMQTGTIPVHFALGKNLVCPLGRVLALESHNGVGRPGRCKICEVNTYSLDPLASPASSSSGDPACFACPEAMTCNGGKDIAPKADFWINPQGAIDDPETVSMFDAEIISKTTRRSASALEVSVFRCAPGACLSNWTCAEGHYGRACALCNGTRVDGKYFTMSASGCVQCDEEMSIVGAVAILTVCGLVVCVLYYLAVWRPWFRCAGAEGAVLSCYTSIQRYQERLSTALLKSTTGYFKVMIGFFQVTAVFVSNFEVDWGPSLETLMAIFNVFNLDLFTLPSTDCAFSNVDHKEKLVISTLLPLFILVLLALPTLGATIMKSRLPEKKHSEICSAFYFASLAFIFLIYPFVSKVVVSTFNCQDLGDSGSWLKSDMRLPCPLASSNFSKTWSIIFTFVFPVGVPVGFVSILYYYKIPQLAVNKVKMHRLRSVLKHMCTPHSASMADPLCGPLCGRRYGGRWDGRIEPVDLLSIPQCMEILKFEFKNNEMPHESADDAIAARLKWSKADLDPDPMHPPEVTGDVRKRTAQLVDELCTSEVVMVPPVVWNEETGESETAAINNAGFLFFIYEAQCWWFETFELMRKLFMTALIIFIADPDVRLGTGFLATFASLLVVASQRPFVDPRLDSLMIAALVTQTLTLSCLSRPLFA